MKRRAMIAFIILLPFLFSFPAAAQDSGLSAIDILNKADDAVNGAKDQSWTLKIVLVDKSGAEKTQELLMLQKGRDRRLAKVLSPADQKGICFLSLPGDVQYLYLPAFGKAQRITSHNLSQNFTATDFTYEDMEAGRQSDRWDAKIAYQDQDAFILELTLKPGQSSDYSKMVERVLSGSFVPVRVEYYDKAGKLCKVLVRQKLEQVQGYWVAMETTMEDLNKKHVTKMIMSDIKFNSGIPDDRFSESSLNK